VEVVILLQYLLLKETMVGLLLDQTQIELQVVAVVLVQQVDKGILEVHQELVEMV
jgi:hypothetical protein